MALVLKSREAKPRLGGPHLATKDLFRLDERTIFITGGGGAMGLTMAGSVLESGGDVILFDLPEAPPQDEYANLLAKAKDHAAQISYHSGDVTSEQSVGQIFGNVVSKARYPLRGIVTCAGISDNGPSIDFPLARFRKVVDVNLTGNFICAQAAAREFTRLGVPGSMVLVASMSGHVSNKGVDTASYNSSKSGIHQLARSLAAEWGSSPSHPLIRVNTLSPGYIRTAATAGALKRPEREQLWSSDNMLNRLSFIDEFRAPIMFLLGDGSGFMTGADLKVDGGHTAW